MEEDKDWNSQARPPGWGLLLDEESNAATLQDPLMKLSLDAGGIPSQEIKSRTPTNENMYVAESLPSSSPVIAQRTPSSTSLNSSNSAKPPLRKHASLTSMRDRQSSTPPSSPKPLSRRASPGYLSTAMAGRQASMEVPKSPATPASVARDAFKRELELQNLNLDLDVVVIFHDSCYGHRYCRPRTTKATLSTIVERPERILATVLGASLAYVLLGSRYADAPHAPHPKSTPDHQPFAIHKSSRTVPLTSPAVTQVHGLKWMSELKIMCDTAEAKLATNGKELERPGSRSAEQKDTRPKLHEGDLYLCSESLNALEGTIGAVFDAVDTVFDHSRTKRAFVAVRPPGHHCSDDYPSGFCWINNVHIGISYAASAYGLTHAAIIDFDLHHGDGSQDITWDHNSKLSNLPKNATMAKKYSIGYFSLHDINSYPCEWGDEEKVRSASLCIENAHGQTIWNVHLQPWKTEAEFWVLYEQRYSMLLDKTRLYLRTRQEELKRSGVARPKAAIFISAGFDASVWEGHGMQRHNVSVPTDFYFRFTQDIVKMADEDGLGVEGRVISVLEGGYSDRALTSGALSHICGLYRASYLPQAGPCPDGALTDARARLVGGMGSQSSGEGFTSTGMARDANPAWWSASRLEELESLVNPGPPPPPPRRPKGPISPKYSTPTQSFTAKMVSPTNPRRSTSGTFSKQASPPVQRGPSPPPPCVGWATAAHELAKHIIPTDRQIRSCRADELNAEATKARRIRQSAVGSAMPSRAKDDVPTEEIQRMQLRGRKSKFPADTKIDEAPEDAMGRGKSSEQASDPKTKVSSQNGAGRRKTIAGTAELEELNNFDPRTKEAPTSRRRVSMASVGSTGTNGQASTAATGAALAVAKARTAAKPRVKKTPIPKIPVREATPPLGMDGTVDVVDSRVVSSGPAKNPDDSVLDGLEHQMKKMSIKINVPNKDEYDAREARKKEGLKSARKPAAKPAVPRPIKTQTKKQSVSKFLAVAGSTPAPSANSDSVVAHNEQATPLDVKTAVDFMTQSDMPHFVPNDQPHEMLPEKSLAVPLPDNQVEVSSLKQFMNMPSSSSPPSKRSRADLPVFNETSPILFGTAAPKDEEKNTVDDDMTELK